MLPTATLTTLGCGFESHGAYRVMSQDIGIGRTHIRGFGLYFFFGVGPGGLPVPW